MNAKAPSYHGYRFPPEIIGHAVWLYYRFCLSFRDVEDLLAKRGVIVSDESIRQWCRKFGAECARNLRRREGRMGDTWYLDELFVTIQASGSISGAQLTTTETSSISSPSLGAIGVRLNASFASY